MAFGCAQHQKSGQSERAVEGRGETSAHAARDEAQPACREPQGPGRNGLMEQALSRENIALAWKRVKANKGSRSPLSPLLANVMLDEVDRVLQQRKHRFAR